MENKNSISRSFIYYYLYMYFVMLILLFVVVYFSVLVLNQRVDRYVYYLQKKAANKITTRL